jgi:hypothetical integral membrane protein (TIGR02206 family)
MVFTEQGAAIVVMLSLLLITLIALFRNVEKLIPYKKYIDLFLFLYAIESMIRHYWMWTIREQYYNYLPLQVCYFTMFIFIYYYLAKDRRMLPFLHIFGFLGIGALIAPGHQFSFTNPLSYIFMIDHIVLGAMPFYIIVVHKYFPTYDKIKIILYTFIPFFIVSIPLSHWLGANYFFLLSNPITGDGVNPWIIAVVQLVMMYVFGVIATYLGQWILFKVYPNIKEETATL